MLKQLGGPDRPAIGDKALATALLRSEGLAGERRLTEITLDFCRALGVQARILPMSDDPVRTQVVTDDGTVSYHEYFTEMGCGPAARSLRYDGAGDARLSDEVLHALHAPDLEAIVICPANPFHVIRPILEVAGMRQLLKERGVPLIAVTPIVGGKALKGSAGKMMAELGREPSALGAASEYLRLIDGFIIDRQDFALADRVRSLGIEVAVAQTVMRSPDERVALARAALDFARSIREKKAAEVE
jgi:LPPG:FO 2-phospho-L-lactate transferase